MIPYISWCAGAKERLRGLSPNSYEAYHLGHLIEACQAYESLRLDYENLLASLESKNEFIAKLLPVARAASEVDELDRLTDPAERHYYPAMRQLTRALRALKGDQ